MKRLFKFRYPKLFILVVLFVLSFFIFSNSTTQAYIDHLGQLKYLGIFIAGLLFSFGFSTPFAAGFFIASHPENIFLAALIAGLGAMIADLLIFKTIKFSFMDEFIRLEKTKPIKEISKLINSRPIHKLKVYILYLFSGIIIASPLPDEIAVSMLAGLTTIKSNMFMILSFVVKTFGIFLLLSITITI